MLLWHAGVCEEARSLEHRRWKHSCDDARFGYREIAEEGGEKWDDRSIAMVLTSVRPQLTQTWVRTFLGESFHQGYITYKDF